jgi:hypothetical protein
LGSHEGELREPVGPAKFPRIHLQVLSGIETAYFPAETDFEIAAIKSLDQSDPAFTSANGGPYTTHIAAQRGDNAKPCHHYSTAKHDDCSRHRRTRTNTTTGAAPNPVQETP